MQQQMVPLSFEHQPPPAPAQPATPAAANDDDEPELDEADTRALIMSRIKRDLHERHKIA